MIEIITNREMVLSGFFIGLSLSLILTPLVRHFARKFGVLDRPDSGRKQHGKAIPLMGGVAVMLAFTLAALFLQSGLLGGFLLKKHLIGILCGGGILVLGGVLDDRYNLPPLSQIGFPAIAALVVIASGIGIDYVTNPFGGTFRMDMWQLPLFNFGGSPHHLTMPGDFFVFLWLMVMMYTTKLLDGLDGLVSGLGVIGFTVIALLSLMPEVAQPELARLAMIAAGAAGGFLFYNGFPASIFLGEGGSTLIGYLLGVMAILSGGKIGVTLLILAVPLMDTAWTIIRRTIIERKSFASADLGHLHFRLQALGLSRMQTVTVFWVFAAAFGGVGLFIPGREKAYALAILGALFILISLHDRSKRKKN